MLLDETSFFDLHNLRSVGVVESLHHANVAKVVMVLKVSRRWIRWVLDGYLLSFSPNTASKTVFTMSENGWTTVPGANLPLESDE